MNLTDYILGTEEQSLPFKEAAEFFASMKQKEARSVPGAVKAVAHRLAAQTKKLQNLDISDTALLAGGTGAGVLAGAAMAHKSSKKHGPHQLTSGQIDVAKKELEAVLQGKDKLPLGTRVQDKVENASAKHPKTTKALAMAAGGGAGYLGTKAALRSTMSASALKRAAKLLAKTSSAGELTKEAHIYSLEKQAGLVPGAVTYIAKMASVSRDEVLLAYGDCPEELEKLANFFMKGLKAVGGKAVNTIAKPFEWGATKAVNALAKSSPGGVALKGGTGSILPKAAVQTGDAASAYRAAGASVKPALTEGRALAGAGSRARTVAGKENIQAQLRQAPSNSGASKAVTGTVGPSRADILASNAKPTVTAKPGAGAPQPSAAPPETGSGTALGRIRQATGSAPSAGRSGAAVNPGSVTPAPVPQTPITSKPLFGRTRSAWNEFRSGRNLAASRKATAAGQHGQAADLATKAQGQATKAKGLRTRIQKNFAGKAARIEGQAGAGVGGLPSVAQAGTQGASGITMTNKGMLTNQAASQGAKAEAAGVQAGKAEAAAASSVKAQKAAVTAEKNMAAYNAGSMETGAALKHLEGQAVAGALTPEMQAAAKTYHAQASKQAQTLTTQIAEKEKALTALKQTHGTKSTVSAMPGEALSGGATVRGTHKSAREITVAQAEIRSLKRQQIKAQKTSEKFGAHLPKETAATPTAATPTAATPTTPTPVVDPNAAAAAAPAAGQPGMVQKATDWAKANPLGAAGIAGVGGLVLGKTMLGGPSYSPNIYKAGSVNIESLKRVAYLEKRAGLSYGAIDQAAHYFDVPVEYFTDDLTLEKVAIIRNALTWAGSHVGRGLGRVADKTKNVKGLQNLSTGWKDVGGNMVGKRSAFVGERAKATASKHSDEIQRLTKATKDTGKALDQAQQARYAKDSTRLGKLNERWQKDATSTARLGDEADKIRGFAKGKRPAMMTDELGNKVRMRGSHGAEGSKAAKDALAAATGRGGSEAEAVSRAKKHAKREVAKVTAKPDATPVKKKNVFEQNPGATAVGGGLVAGGGLIAAGQQPEMVANVKTTKLASALEANRELFLKMAMEGKFLGISPKPPKENINAGSSPGGAAIKTVAKNFNKGQAKVDRVPTFKGM